MRDFPFVVFGETPSGAHADSEARARLLRSSLWEVVETREATDQADSETGFLRKQYGKICDEANEGAILAEIIAPALVENILCGDTYCVWTPFIQSGVTDCIQTFARLVFQALSVPMRYPPHSIS
jgi:hypothetical protein